jgi:hypothetical protein
MRGNDLPTRLVVSRRALLGAPPAILLSGCTSATEQANKRFFAAVEVDPLFSWRPDWATFDNFGEHSALGATFEDEVTDVRRLIGGNPVPPGGTDAASAFAVSVGWSPETTSFFRKNFETKSGPAGCRLQISSTNDMSSLFLWFVSWVATS